MRLMLDNHPHLSSPGESDFLFDYVRRQPDGGWRIDADAVRRDRIFQASGITCPDGLSAEETVAEMLAQLAALKEGRRLVLMTHRALGVAHDLYPQTPIIHMLRDPRDVARSSIGMGWAGNVYHGVFHWIETEKEWRRVAPRLSAEKHTVMRYEDLIRDPKAELDRITRFMGLSFDPAMLSYDESSTYSAPDISLIEQWRRKQTPYEVGLVEHHVGDLLQSTGYTPSGHPLQNPTGLALLRLRYRNKSAIWQQRIRRYGFFDPFFATVTRKLGVPALGYAAERRINEKTKAYLK